MWITEILEWTLIIVDLIAVPVCFGLLIYRADQDAIICRLRYEIGELKLQRDELLAERRARAGNGKIKAIEEVEV